MRLYGLSVAGVVFALGLSAAGSQPGRAPSGAAPPQATASAVPTDPLGRSTPRGTVLGFLDAARRRQHALARQYVETRSSGRTAEELARQLFVVLDARLPARLQDISDGPEGSRSDPLAPNRELVGTLVSERGEVPVFLDRVQRDGTGPIWLFSSTTLESIPALYEEVASSRASIALPRFMTRTRIGGVQLVDWLVVLAGITLFFVGTVLLNRLLLPLMRPLWRRLSGESGRPFRNVLPLPARLLLLVILGRWMLSALPLSLLVRQFWSNITGLITIVSVVWLLILVNGEIERAIRRRKPGANATAAASLLRVFRRTVDVLVVFSGMIVTLRHFDIDPTPALAGLGVGGIAVALAAQKTLENVIAGASLVFDQAVRVGDFLKMGDIMGTVDHIGLRSTRIRTLDRSVVSVPNGQIANASLETFSARDKFWFHPEVRLRCDTTPEQLRAVLEGISRLLSEHPSVDRQSIRARFHRLGPFSFDIDVFAYFLATDWEHFLQIQEQLLFGVTETVRLAGTALALPSQTMFVSGAQPLTELPDAAQVRTR